MMSPNPISIMAILAACGYYVSVWIVYGRRSNKRSVVPRYEPPAGLSPAMVRYTWKECFDDRTLWAAVLSLVSKNLATIDTEADMGVLRPGRDDQGAAALPQEEQLLLKRVANSKKRGILIDLLDENTATTVSEMAELLRRNSAGVTFVENRSYVLGGIFFSLIGVCLFAAPSTKDGWVALGLAVMAPGAFYLIFVALRMRDVFLAAREQMNWLVMRRGAILLGLAAPCVAAIVLGSVVITTTFGWPTIVAAIFLTGITLWFSGRIKLPTASGVAILDQIEGFRVFLQSVERLPMDREDAPSKHAGLYEKYLPYAVALEVDQKWSDRLVTLSSTMHRREGLFAAHSFYLGMWNGKPVEMVFAPPPPGRRF